MIPPGIIVPGGYLNLITPYCILNPSGFWVSLLDVMAAYGIGAMYCFQVIAAGEIAKGDCSVGSLCAATLATVSVLTRSHQRLPCSPANSQPFSVII